MSEKISITSSKSLVKILPPRPTTQELWMYRLAEFPAGGDFMIVDKLVHGCNNAGCKRKLMSKDKDITVKQCLDLLRKHEAVNATMKHIEGATSSQQINAAYRDPTRKSQTKGAKVKAKTFHNKKQDKGKKCPWCGGVPHSWEECPANKSKCNFCHKDSHFERACLRKSLKASVNMRSKIFYVHVTSK